MLSQLMRAVAALLVLSSLVAAAGSTPITPSTLALLPAPHPNPQPRPHAHSRRLLAGRRKPHRHGLVYYGFPVRALAENPLDPTSLALHAKTALTSQSTNNVLALLRYAAACGLKASQNVTVAVPWPSGQKTLTLQGGLGLAPDWARYPLTLEERRYVTACLAARTNLLGERVHVSLRIPGRFPADGPEEVQKYPVLEGAFWGNMFSRRAPRVCSCTGPDADTPRRAKRFCAHGRPVPPRDPRQANSTALEFCGDITPLGPCSSMCQGLSDDGYSACQGQREVMTVYLGAAEAAPADSAASQ